jgi:hypothetical protein
MAEIKFSCPQCGQHIAGNEQWSGHQIQCPTCATTLTVPGAPPPTPVAAPGARSLVPQPPVSQGPKLSAGATQVTRPPASGSIPLRQPPARPPRSQSPLLKYAGYAVVLAVLGGAGYLFLPSLLNKIQDSGDSTPAKAAPAAERTGAGPLGEVNGAMDVSDALDGGGSSTPRRAPPRPPAAAQRPAPPTANPAARSTNDAARARFRQPMPPPPAGGGRP